ncbi:MAG: hypothetical protein JNL74_18060, partial [Fibrobacteres bacterium]|nr:hypothetical protein [Fibrobacterota bacterium]
MMTLNEILSKIKEPFEGSYSNELQFLCDFSGRIIKIFADDLYWRGSRNYVTLIKFLKHNGNILDAFEIG